MTKHSLKIESTYNEKTEEMTLSVTFGDFASELSDTLKDMVNYEMKSAARRISERIDHIAEGKGMKKVEVAKGEGGPAIKDLIKAMPEGLAAVLTAALLDDCDCESCQERRKDSEDEKKADESVDEANS